LPFVLHRYKRRKTFAVGAVLFFIIINVLASFIWSIEVSGNKDVRSADILKQLEALGVKPGTIKYGIDVNKIANKLMLEIKELSWVSFEISGTVAKVYVEERRQPPELVDKDTPCDIVAERDGVIYSIVVKSGQEVVKKGDSVVKGQLLVSGTIEYQNEPGQKWLVHSIAEVKARTWYEESSTVNLRTVDAVRTGKVINNYILLLFNKKIKLPINKSIDFQNYDKVELKKVMRIGENFIFRIGIIIEQYHENMLVEKELSVDEAKDIAKENALKKLVKIIPYDAQIINQRVTYSQGENDVITANVIIECLEDIGITKKIGGE